MASETHAFDPDWRIPPGEILSELMEDLHISNRDMRDMLGMGAVEFQEFLKGTVPITQLLANKMADMLPMNAQFWLNLQTEFVRPITPKKSQKPTDDLDTFIEEEKDK